MNASSPKLTAWIDGVGLIGPGLESWESAQPILTKESRYESRPLVVTPPAMLPAAERRRCGLTVKIALAVAQEALNFAQLDPKKLATVFTSSSADGDNCDAICKALASDDRHISPTRFHNSVHNAPAGYWGIASGAMTPATVLCAYDGSFGAGLLESMVQVVAEDSGTLLVAYDAPYPEPLNGKRPLPFAFGMALTLMPARSKNSIARIQVSLDETPQSVLEDEELEAIRKSIPVARCLPLLSALASKKPAQVVLDYLSPLQMNINLEPCQ